MRIPRWLVPWRKMTDMNTVTPMRDLYSMASRFGTIFESFGGAWQRGLVLETCTNIMAFSAVHSCVSLIADDISKLRPKLMQVKNGIWTEIADGSPSFLPVLRKPNRYQTRIQFLSQWMTSLLLHGNTYVLKERDGKGSVTELYILDARCVQPKVAPDGEVYYQLHHDWLAGVPEGAAVVSSSEIIHDRMITPWHPLCGVSPIYACGASATQGIRIQANSERFFSNMSRPGGVLKVPGNITTDQLKLMKEMFEQNYSGGNIGRLLVATGGSEFSPITIPAQDSQLIEQLKWTVEDVARCFHVPLHKISTGQNPTFTNVGAMNQDYYSQTLQARIESIELLLDEGLSLPKSPDKNYAIELDLECLLRMDPKTRAETHEILMRAGIEAPNEGRMVENLPPVAGGESPMIQMQNFSLAALAKRDAKEDPFATAAPARSTDQLAPPRPETKPKGVPVYSIGPVAKSHLEVHFKRAA